MMPDLMDIGLAELERLENMSSEDDYLKDMIQSEIDREKYEKDNPGNIFIE